MNDLDFHHQFILSAKVHTRINGWDQHYCGSFYLQTHPMLPVLSVKDPFGHAAGFALGWIVGENGSMVSGEISFPCSISKQNEKIIEEFIYGFGGRFIFILLGKDFSRLYPDAGATLGVVYSNTERVAGSTVSILVLNKKDHPIWSRPPGMFPDNRPMQYYPAGLTMDPAIRRLLPNHYLDLDSWSSVRNYPDSESGFIPYDEIDDCIEEVVRLIRNNIFAVANNTSSKVYMSLTAGLDSRTLLACTRDIKDLIEFVTFDYTPVSRSREYLVDLHIAKKIAKQFKLNHTIIPVYPDYKGGLDTKYLHRIGFSGGAGKSRDFFRACAEYLDTSGAWMPGFVGEVGRLYYCREDDLSLESIGAQELLKKMRLPLSKEFIDEVDKWVSGLPEIPVPMLLNFAVLEHPIGCWAAPHMYGAAPFSVSLIPFSYRTIIDIMLRLPVRYSINRRFARDIISSSWPGLNQFPFNDFTGIDVIRDRVSKIMRSIRRSLLG